MRGALATRDPLGSSRCGVVDETIVGRVFAPVPPELVGGS